MSFEASKLKVLFMGEEARIVQRTYIFSYCDFTVNLPLTISSIIDCDQFKGWYNQVECWGALKDAAMVILFKCYC
ncbi:hypothetical protein ABFX02_08G160700 [Erythranthe guttata]